MKVKCISNINDEEYFTVGMIYDMSTAGLLDDTGDSWHIHHTAQGETVLDKWNSYYSIGDRSYRCGMFIEVEDKTSLKVSAESYNVTSDNFTLVAAQDAIYGESEFWDCFTYEEAQSVLYVLKNIPHDKINEFVSVAEKCIELQPK